ncbi:GrpB family protein [Devosia sp.]|uniref:GrpB family protein n=1 Tax=Devosia sp. TaxID=1871048 RepID=UPI00326726A5
MAEAVHIVAYDPNWPKRYQAEAALVLSCFPHRPLRIEHMGSTAVPGLSAKPVIDLIVLVDDLAQAKLAVPALEATGYSYWAANPDTSKLFLVKGLPPAPQRTHHLHVYTDASEFDRHMVFRDALRSEPTTLAAYQGLKTELAERFWHDREAYTNAKATFIDGVVARLR